MMGPVRSLPGVRPTAPATALMALENVRYGHQNLLRGVDLEILAGSRTVLLGPNGAGKSLILRILHGLIRPDSGEVLWRGRPLDRTARRRQAMVFQTPVLLRRSVAANLDFALRARGVARRDRADRRAALLESARLSALAARPARRLSGGEQQRLALAAALAAEPDLLLLDEPTASLDPAATHAIERQIDAAHARGATVVMVTHDAGQARRMADRIAFVQSGRIVEAAPARQLLDAPRSLAAQDWMAGRLHLPDESD